jgi:hypothetical protein
MINYTLKNVTLACIDDLNSSSSFQLLSHLSELISFGDLILFSNKLQFSHARNRAKIRNLDEYNRFLIYDLHKHIKTDFCMIVQTDGYFVNLDSWEDEFLNYDYIGAPWVQPDLPEDKKVGNGGFCIRSKRLLEYSSRLEDYNEGTPEDVFICNFNREKLENDGIKFAPIDLASRFSVENSLYQGQFGFHGKATLDINRNQIEALPSFKKDFC